MSVLSSMRRQSASPSQSSQLAWEFNGGAGCRRFLGCGVGEGAEESRDVAGLRGVGECRCIGAESQEEVGDGIGTLNGKRMLKVSVNLSSVEQVEVVEVSNNVSCLLEEAAELCESNSGATK